MCDIKDREKKGGMAGKIDLDQTVSPDLNDE